MQQHTTSTLQLFQKLKLWKGILGQGSTEQNVENGFKISVYDKVHYKKKKLEKK